MAENNKEPRKGKTIRFRFNLSWIYIILLIAIGWMFFNQSGANPQKEEWVFFMPKKIITEVEGRAS
jgi:ATP-dependent Zn protease